MPEVILLTIFAFCFRFLTIRHAHANFDTYGHLYFAKEVKTQKVGPFGDIEIKIIGSDRFTAPFVWHWFIGLFPFDTVLRYQRWINPATDAVFAVVIYWCALRMELDARTAVLMSLFYLLTPMFFSRFSSGPRIATLTPRLSSEIVTNVFFIVTLLPLKLPVMVVFICGALLSAFVVLSSKFGLQAMTFLVPITSIFAHDPTPVYALTLGIALAIALTKGRFFKAMSSQYNHLVWYFKKNLKGEMTLSKRNKVASLLAKPSSGGGALKHVGVVLLRLISLNSYTSVLLKMPILPSAFVLYVYLGGERLPYYIEAPIITGTIFFFLINFPALLFLGEAERYLNHVAFFIVAMAAMLIDRSPTAWWVAWALLGYGFLYWLLESFIAHKLLPESERSSASADKILSHLKSLPHEMVVLAYPYHAVGVWRIMAETIHRVIYCVATTKEFAAEFENNYADNYPFVRLEKLDGMAQEYGVNYLIVRKKHLVSRGLAEWTPSSQWMKLDVGEPEYIVYQRDICS